jgi:hypothetical protein
MSFQAALVLSNLETLATLWLLVFQMANKIGGTLAIPSNFNISRRCMDSPLLK